jgi:hypothetical protein
MLQRLERFNNLDFYHFSTEIVENNGHVSDCNFPLLVLLFAIDILSVQRKDYGPL